MRRLRIVFTLVVLLGIPVLYFLHRLGGPTEIVRNFPPPSVIELPPLVEPGGLERVQGRVETADGVPVNRALVELVAGGRPYWTYTGDDGRFVLLELPLGTFEAAVIDAPPFAPKTFTLRVPAEEEVVWQLEPVPPPLDVLPDIERANLIGRIHPAVGCPARDCLVLLEPAPGTDLLSGAVPRRTRVDVSGRYELPDLALGTYELTLLPPGAVAGDGPALGQATYAHTGVGEVPLLELRASILQGELRDKDGLPIEGALVLASSEDDEKSWGTQSATTDDQGRFLLRYVTPGRWRVRARAGAADEVRIVGVEAGRARTIDFGPIDVE